MRKPFIAGNWKMFKTVAEAREFAEEFKKIYVKDDVRVAFCVPYTQLAVMTEVFSGTGIEIGAQNMHFEDEGAYTGEISAKMLRELGVRYCIIGHSERRQYFGETDETVNKKLHKAFAEGIHPIMCVGESADERDSGKAFDTVKRQLTAGLSGLMEDQVSKLVIAYEPIWAIGTGRTATPEQADEMCGFIRDVIEELYGDAVSCSTTIQYGGSVKPENAGEIMNMPEIDGALVGGASLKPQDFIQIVNF